MSLCLLIAASGAVASTFGPALLALLLTRVRDTPASATTHALPRLEILIPAHNEENLIVGTLRSIEASFDECPSPISLPISLTVGLDHCTDQTREKLDDEQLRLPFPVLSIENPGAPGKWTMLNELIRQSRGEWLALVDCGAQWRRGLLNDVYPLFCDEGTLGISPSYCPESAGFLSRWNWRLEAALKSLETRAGGPVSVHGATVFYRRNELIRALDWLATLGEAEWINDDVVIPLALRGLHPARRIRYLAKNREGFAYVGDLDLERDPRAERRRRQRMVLGNFQWISRVFFPRLLREPLRTAPVSCIAARRVFRVFWAYWVGLAAIGAGTRIASLPLVLASLTVAVFVFRKRGAVIAFISGLAAPLLLKRLREGNPILWS